MTRLGFSALASALALAFFANTATAADGCVDDDGSPCTLTLDFSTDQLNAAIGNEKAAREQADETETTERRAADETEKAAREAADETEKAAREQADETETTERKAADETEKAAREAADNDLGDRITNEAAASRARDDALGKRIDKNSEAIEDAIALSAAIPDSWLSDSESFAIAVGGGFTDGSTAFGGIGTFRLSKNLSAYGGGSTLTDGGTWAAKGGVRLGW